VRISFCGQYSDLDRRIIITHALVVLAPTCTIRSNKWNNVYRSDGSRCCSYLSRFKGLEDYSLVIRVWAYKELRIYEDESKRTFLINFILCHWNRELETGWYLDDHARQFIITGAHVIIICSAWDSWWTLRFGQMFLVSSKVSCSCLKLELKIKRMLISVIWITLYDMWTYLCPSKNV